MGGSHAAAVLPSHPTDSERVARETRLGSAISCQNWGRRSQPRPRPKTVHEADGKRVGTLVWEAPDGSTSSGKSMVADTSPASQNAHKHQGVREKLRQTSNRLDLALCAVGASAFVGWVGNHPEHLARCGGGPLSADEAWGYGD